MPIRFQTRGDWKATKRFLSKCERFDVKQILDSAGKRGVDALRSATPVKSGRTAAGWYYEIHHSLGKTTIEWCNSNVNQGVNIAVILQYGHGQHGGGYVAGRDYINPAIRPVFDDIAQNVWKALMNSG